MIELPESHALAEQLSEIVVGKRIQNVTAGTSPHRFAFFFGEPDSYHGLLSGKQITQSQAFGGLIELTLQDEKLVFGDGVALRFFAAGEKLPAKHQLHIEFDDFTSLVCTVQMYGGLWAFHQGENQNPYYLVAKEKPSPLSSQFDETVFQSMLESVKPILSVKAFLATEQRIPGLGNGTLQDILFRSRIHPKRKINTLSDTEIQTLFTTTKQTLLEMTVKGGRDTEKDLFGVPGGYSTLLSKKTFSSPCPVCGDTIHRENYLGGNIYFCPTCQPL